MLVKFTEEEISQALIQIKLWSYTNGQISRSVKFSKFSDAVLFFNRVAGLAEAMKHHPDFSNSYTHCTLAIHTHDVGGLSMLDFDFAKEVDKIIVEMLP